MLSTVVARLRRRWNQVGVWGVILALALAVAGAGFLSPWVLRLAYPIRYGDVLEQVAAETGLDPYLLLAVIKVESGFNPRAKSTKGARGLMQVMPDTGEWVARQLGMGRYHPDMLYEPQVNLVIGSWYLSYLLQRFHGRLAPALAAYNGGQGNVQRWLESLRWNGELETIRDIPFEETRTYVKRVITAYERYRWAYRGARNVAFGAAGPLLDQ